MKLTDEQIDQLLPLIDFHAGLTSGKLEDLITDQGLDYDNEDIEDLMTVYKDLLAADRMADADADANAEQHLADNPVTSETVIDKDNDGDIDVTITEQDDGDDKKSEPDKPHDQGLAGDTTLEEELMLKPNMSPTEFSEIAAGKRGAKPGEPAPDFNFTNDIAKALSSRRW